MPNGTIYTRYYKNWNTLSQEDKDKVLAERKKRGIDKSHNSNKGKGIKFMVAEIQALVFEYTPKVCENQIVMAGPLLTVVIMRPSTASNSHE